MKAVWKFPVPIKAGRVEVEMPSGAEVLHFALQDGAPFIWALVDPAAAKETVTFKFVGTGTPVGPGITKQDYTGTIHVHGDSEIYHLFLIS